MASTLKHFDKVYFFSRMLINSDKYGGIGKDTTLLIDIAREINLILSGPATNDAKLALCHSVISEKVKNRYLRALSKTNRIDLFIQDINVQLTTLEDVNAFALTAEHLVAPTNKALENIPSDDKFFTQKSAQEYLDVHGDKALSTVIKLWDDLGVFGCLNAERVEIVTAFSNLRNVIASFDEATKDIILTAFVQEFERRLGQKRKGRAGGSLEDVTSFLLNYYKIDAVNQPEHFQADIEIDKWVKCKNGWLIGISCKRTLRERWKQVSSASSEILGKHRILEVWHLITYDEDLSDDKLANLGAQRHKFYLPDDSRRYLSCFEHDGLKSYVRPMSALISDLRQKIG